jgi:hypothetical protein
LSKTAPRNMFHSSAPFQCRLTCGTQVKPRERRPELNLFRAT